MVRVRTSTTEPKILYAKQELDNPDKQVNMFIKENNIKRVISMNGACTADDKGAIMDIIRSLAYEAPDKRAHRGD